MLISCELAMKLEICYALPALVERVWRNVMVDCSKEEIIRILMRRDGETYEGAVNRVEECQHRFNCLIDGSGGADDVDDILREELGLEPDYVEAFLC